MPATETSPSRTGSTEAPAARPPEADAIARAEADLAVYRELGLLFEAGADHTERWNEFFSRGRQRLFDREGRIDPDVIRNFWRNQVFLGDNPRFPKATGLGRLSGPRRGELEMARVLKRILRKAGARELAEKYPCPKAGRPRVFRMWTTRVTHRWAKHLYHLSRVNQYLGPRLDAGFVTLDIGSGHGLFSTLMHQEYPGSHCVLVDLPEQLLLARYFLESTFPGARIGGVQQFAGRGPISRDALAAYDFVLLPWQFYRRLEAGSVDLITSFAALGELRRHVFDGYVQAPVFRSVKYVYLSNPVQSDQMFAESDVTLMDYPLARGGRCLYFGISPVMHFRYNTPVPRRYFFYEFTHLPPFFEYIGGIETG